MDYNFLSNTELFRGIHKNDIVELLKCLSPQELNYKKDKYIYRMGDFVKKIGLVANGQIAIEYYDLWGNKSILDIITDSNIFLETYACLPNEPLMVNVVTITKTTVIFFDISYIIERCNNNCSYHSQLIANLLTISAQKNLNLSMKIFHTTPKKIRDRLLSYLSYQAIKQNSYEFDIPFNRQHLADYLNIDRSALSNELSKMTKENLLKTYRNHFVLNKEKIDTNIIL